MSDIRETGSLEEQLRQDQRREAARRRRKRLPWMIPLALLAVLIGVGLYLLISNQNPKTPRTAETEAPHELGRAAMGGGQKGTVLRCVYTAVDSRGRSTHPS